MSKKDKIYAKLLADYDKHCLLIAKATSVNIHESAKEKAARIKNLESDYVRWFEYYFPNYAKQKCAWFHAKLAKLIVGNKRLRLLSEMYRSAGKSVHIDMGIPLYLYFAKNDLRFMLLVGETEPKAKKLLSGIQAQLEHNNRLQNDYGKRASVGDWSDGSFVTSDGVRFMSIGFGQNPRGAREQSERPDYIVVDDVDSKKSIHNDRIMRESVDYITEDVWGCFDSEDNATERFVFANNNFHKNSITNCLKTYFNEVINTPQEEQNYESNIAQGRTLFKILTVCAVKNLQDFTPEWPEKTSAEYWRNKFKSMPYRSFMREYMHTHIEDGAIFKYEDIQYKKALPLSKYDNLCFYGDLSYKENADYKALILVGNVGKEFHILLCYMQQKSRAHCAKWLYDQYERFHLDRYNVRYMIEGLFAMDEFVSDFDNEGDKRGYYIPIVADKRSKTDKFDRIESLSGYFERKNVWFNTEQKDADMQVLIDQFLAFEKGSGAHDDGPDAVHGAFKWLVGRNRQSSNQYAFGARVNNHY